MSWANFSIFFSKMKHNLSSSSGYTNQCSIALIYNLHISIMSSILYNLTGSLQSRQALKSKSILTGVIDNPYFIPSVKKLEKMGIKSSKELREVGTIKDSPENFKKLPEVDQKEIFEQD